MISFIYDSPVLRGAQPSTCETIPFCVLDKVHSDQGCCLGEIGAEIFSVVPLRVSRKDSRKTELSSRLFSHLFSKVDEYKGKCDCFPLCFCLRDILVQQQGISSMRQTLLGLISLPFTSGHIRIDIFPFSLFIWWHFPLIN